MAAIRSKLGALFSRVVKALVAVALFPLVVGLLLAVRSQLAVVSASGSTFGQWLETGFVTYVVLHVLLYRPVGLFRAGRVIFSTLAVWLFGGQVASVEGGAAGKKGKSEKDAKVGGTAQGSTLVAFSPYVVPLYTVLVCLAGWALGRWADRAVVEGPVSFFLGTTLAFHWLMTADELQEQRARWHVETYLLAIELVFVLTLLIAAACLPLAVPDFSFVAALSEALARTQEIYTAAVQRLFF